MSKRARQWLAAGCMAGGMVYLFMHGNGDEMWWHLVPFAAGALVVFPELGRGMAELVKAWRAK